MNLYRQWCADTGSFVTESDCNQTIPDLTCKTKVAKTPDHCYDTDYDPNAPEKPPQVPQDAVVKDNTRFVTQLFFKGLNDTDYYLLTKNNRVTKYKGALGAYIVCIILGIMAEMAKFMKWYIVVRKRVTHNSLGVII